MAGAGGGSKIGRKLRQHDVAHARQGRHGKHLRHVIERAVERARAFPHGHGRNRKLVERHSRDDGSFGETCPDVGEHDDDKGRQVEKRDQPGISQPVGEARAAHEQAEQRAERHGNDEHAPASRRD
jgi:hypothetical protein